MEHSNKRIVQQRDKKAKSVYITLPEETGLRAGDVVEFQTISKGYVMLKKLETVNVIKDESFLDKMLEAVGLHGHIVYRLKETNEEVSACIT